MRAAEQLFALALISMLVLQSTPVAAGDALVVVRQGVEGALADRIERAVRKKRTVLPMRPFPSLTQSPVDVANTERVRAIAAAIERARRHEEVADWNACAKEAGDKLGLATEVLTTSNRLDMLRDLHLQIGACMSLSGEAENALPHFHKATLLDETPPPKGRHREEAELVHERARSEVLARLRGPVRIETDPAGAEVWIDGNKASGVTPLDVDVRLGTHFITLRRFRFEPETRAMLVQPRSTVRFVLGEARRDTLRQQLGEVNAGRRKPPPDELQLARAVWSKASQVLMLSKPAGPTAAGVLRVTLRDARSGRDVRGNSFGEAVTDDELQTRMCALLAQPCPVNEGVATWVWVVVGVATAAAVAGAAISIGFYADSQRETVFCPPGGCD